MTFMSEREWAAARLSHIADQDSVPAGGFGCDRREPFQEIHKFGMTPVAIAGNPHHLPGRPIGWQFGAPLKTPARVVANGHGLAESRQFLFGEQGACV